MPRTTQVALDRAPNEIVTTRLLEAPRELVWRAFTDHEQISGWWGPVGFTTTTQAMDLRVGGAWAHTMHGPDGRDWPNHIAYTRVEPPALLAWDHGTAPGAEPLFRVVVTFEDLGGRTLLTLRHRFPSAEARDTNIRTVGSVQGAIDTTERLAAHLLTLPGERDFVIARTFDAPREQVWRAWTDAGRLARWWGPTAFTNTVCEFEARVGGRWRVTMSGAYPGPEISHYPIEGEVVELVEPERLLLTIDCARHPGWWHDRVNPGRTPEDRNPAGTMLMTVTFEALTPARTRLTIRERMVSAEILASMRAMGMEQGWSESLHRLGAELQRMAA
jgi:uncharacterized protein YndB with AHSA1/START domain